MVAGDKFKKMVESRAAYVEKAQEILQKLDTEPEMGIKFYNVSKDHHSYEKQIWWVEKTAKRVIKFNTEYLNKHWGIVLTEYEGYRMMGALDEYFDGLKPKRY